MMLRCMVLIHCTFHPRVCSSIANHSHEHQKWHWVSTGRCGFAIGDDVIEIRPGELLVIENSILGLLIECLRCRRIRPCQGKNF